jgi:hypothetical protein
VTGRSPRTFWDALSAQEMLAMMELERWYLDRIIKAENALSEARAQAEEWRNIAETLRGLS